jgi:hypothetical protein
MRIANPSETGHPFGPRVGVPLDMFDSEAVARREAEADERYGSSSAVIPGVRFEDGHPLDLRTPADLGVVRHAVSAGWGVRPEMKKVVVDTMMTILKDADMARDKINAAKVLVAADRIDQKQAGGGTTVNVGVNVDVKSMTTEDLAKMLAQIEAEESGS